MGVPKLWDELQSAATVHSLTALACDAFKTNSNGKRGYRLGIDASIWSFHMEYGKEGENPELRLFFFRCAILLQAPFLPLFIFDGPMRPTWKRGKRINAAKKSPLVDGMQRIIDAFGFEWKLAPGEAEAELAYLNFMGVIDGILSDDVDNFLFGAETVIRNPSNNLSGNKSNKALNASGKDDGQHVRIFRSKDLNLSKEDMVLIGLCSGGDYNTGIDGCGIKISVGLAKAGFGTRLVDARRRHADSSSMEIFLHGWREDLRKELMTNSSGFLGRKSPSLAKKVPDDFPDLNVLDSYLDPVTSRSKGRKLAEYYNPDKMWEKEPNLELIASFCEISFEWGFLDIIIKRFRTLLWPGIVVRILRRAVLERDSATSSSTAPRTPRKRGPAPMCETPSKLLAKHFNALSVGDDSDSDDSDALFSVITRTREHASTDGMPEYRVTVNPASLVRMATQGVKGIRTPVAAADWTAEDEDEGGYGKPKAKAPIDPLDPVLLWLPECMFKLAEPAIVEVWEDGIRKKEDKKAEAERKKAEREQKKAEKALGATTSAKRSTKASGKAKAASTSDLPRQMNPSSSTLWSPDESEASGSTSGRYGIKEKNTRDHQKRDPKSSALWNPEESEESEDEIIARVAPKAKEPVSKSALSRAATTGTIMTKAMLWADSDNDDFDLPAFRPIRDLSIKKKTSTGNAPSAETASMTKSMEIPRSGKEMKKATTMPSWQEVSSDKGSESVPGPAMNLTKPVQKPAMLNLKTVKGIHAVSKRGKGDVSPLTKSSSVRSRDLFDEDDESIVLSTTARVKAKSKQTREWADVSSDEGGSRDTTSLKHSLSPITAEHNLNKSPRKNRSHNSPRKNRPEMPLSHPSSTLPSRAPQPFPMLPELDSSGPETRPTTPLPRREVVYISSSDEADNVLTMKQPLTAAGSDSEIEFLD